jgi:ABC-type polysaccharide/polyol phosphate export permease
MSMDVATGSSFVAHYRLAVEDVVEGFRRWEFWSLLGWNELRKRYHRSLMGPLWSTLSLAIFVTALGGLYAGLMQRNPADYIPHLVLGMIAWNFLFNTLQEGCSVFLRSAAYIQEIDIPQSTFVLALVWHNLIVFFYQCLVYIVVALIYGIELHLHSILVLPGLILILANSIWMALLLGLVTARYRDIREIVASVLRILFFVTPIIWMPDMVDRFAILAGANPIYHFIEVFRSPFLGADTYKIAFITVLVFAVFGWALTLYIFGSCRNRLPFWV